ncbi:hypothetical protein [Mesorhizobium sp. SEMIA 3007]|uniref:hypothetical protein n=1 Tax=Mesorhizobium sp. SEMIA 3007 TaxID=1862350 RepID=UPI0009F1B311|nr:hypothetical protein [Mesorhizobium sp. SEMIA 3007]
METAAPTGIGNGGNFESSNSANLSEARRGRNSRSAQDRWNAAHPLEVWAHASLRSAIKRGLIDREPCKVCGAEKTDGHHSDYLRPLHVDWLCRLHHKAEHRRMKCEAAT